MYLIINPINNTICSKWHYMNDHTEHICWETAKQIEQAGSYRNDTTAPVKFHSQAKARAYIKKSLNNQQGLEIVTTSYIQHLVDMVEDKAKHLFKHDNTNNHMTSCY